MPLEVIRSPDPEKAARRLDVAARQALLLTAARVQFRAVQLMEQERPGTIATGTTQRTISVSKVMRGHVAGAGIVHMVTVGPRTKYARWGIGSGRGPGTPPPLKAIGAWLREKPYGAALTDRQMWLLARRIQKSIAQRGTKEYHILERALAAERPHFPAIVRATMRNAMGR